MAENNFRADRLEQAIHTYGLKFDETVKWDNEKMIKLLGDYFLDLEPKKYSWGARYVQSLDTVMLCKHMKDFIKQMEPINPLESDDYVAETKLNGMRCISTYSPDTSFEFFSRKESVSNYLNGNFTNKYLFIEKGLITEPKDYKNRFNYRFVLDGELLVDGIENEIKTTQVSIEDYIQSIFSSNVERAKEFQKDGHRLKFVVFDVLYFEKNPEIPSSYVPKYFYGERELTPDVINWVEQHFAQYLASAGIKSAGRAKLLYQYLYSLKFSNENDMRRLPFKTRRRLRHLLVNMLQKANLPIFEVDGEDEDKISFLEDTLSSGKEGIILKNIHAPYISTMRSSRGHRAAMKVKQSISSMLNNNEKLVEDFDVFITGANPPKSDRITNMIGSLSCSIYIRKKDGSVIEHEVANVTGITHEWKKKLAVINSETGKISLNPEYEGKVITIDGLALTAGKLKFQHATLRDKNLSFKAKNPSECVWDEDALKEMTLTRGE